MSTGSSRPSKTARRADPLPRQPRGNAREHVRETLRREIISLRLPPGVALSENELAARLGCSRTPVRESLIMLQSEGLVHVIPQTGTFVALVDPERVAEAQFIREAIECSSLQAVCGGLAQTEVDALTDNLDRQRECAANVDADAFFELDEEFHRILLRAAGHESAWRTINTHKSHLDRARRLSLANLRPLTALVEQHRRIAAELVAGDRDAAVSSLRSHLREIFEDVQLIRSSRPELFQESDQVRAFRTTITELR